MSGFVSTRKRSFGIASPVPKGVRATIINRKRGKFSGDRSASLALRPEFVVNSGRIMRNAYSVRLSRNTTSGLSVRPWIHSCVDSTFRFISLQIHSVQRKVSV